MLDIKKIRDDFPALNQIVNGKKAIYLDSACMSLKPTPVLQAMNEYYLEFPACVGRSSYRWGITATKKVKEARQTVAKFINALENEIVFVRNTTEAINLIANSFGFKEGNIVITSDKEHNSNLIPWQLLSKKKGVVHKIANTTEDGIFDLENFRSMVKGAKLVSIVHTSNLDGVTMPVEEIISIAHEHGALVLLDAAQSIPHQKIDVKGLDVDFLAFSGHKALGPTGTGVLYGKSELLDGLEPFLVGGNTVSHSSYADHELLKAPEKFEAGLQDYAGIIGLGAALKYLESVGFDNIRQHEYELNSYISEELSKSPKIKIIGPADPHLRSGIVSFYIDGIDMHQVSVMLDEMSNIMVRSGQHCVHSWFDSRKIKNSARVSLYFYNTMEEAIELVSSLNKIIKIL
jgi:cysteine desulfurase/selenocysteine lyase